MNVLDMHFLEVMRCKMDVIEVRPVGLCKARSIMVLFFSKPFIGVSLMCHRMAGASAGTSAGSGGATPPGSDL